VSGSLATTSPRFPGLDADAIRPTRDALHTYARVLGDWLKRNRARRKHWWHASLRPSLHGLTTGIVNAGIDFEIELDLDVSQLRVITLAQHQTEDLNGQSAASIADWLEATLTAQGVDPAQTAGAEVRGDVAYTDYSPGQARYLHRVFLSVTAALTKFRAGIREETSPIQVWPHHFDLSMLWLPGPKVPGQEPANEEYADKQMNFGFVFGDEAITEPYFYVTAYPLPAALAKINLPAGTKWHSEGFSGAILLYKDLISVDDPAAYLQDMWSTLLAAGKQHLLA